MRTTRLPAPDLDEQKLWCVTWGTNQALVWALTDLWAEIRTRRRCFDRYTPQAAVCRLPRLIDGPVTIRPATQADIDLFAELGARLPPGCDPSPRHRMEASS